MNRDIVKKFNDKILQSNEFIDGNPAFVVQKNPKDKYGFTTITKCKTKYWRCKETQERNGKLIRCICILSQYKFEKLTPDEKENLKYHTHIFPSIEQFARPFQENTNREPDKEIEKLDIVTEKLIKLVGMKNISISTAVSSEMRELIEAAIEWGRKNPHKNASSLVCSRSRPIFTHSFIEFAKILKSKQINTMKI